MQGWTPPLTYPTYLLTPVQKHGENVLGSPLGFCVMLFEASQLSIMAPSVHPGTSDQRSVMLIVCVNAQFVCGYEPSDPEAFLLV